LENGRRDGAVFVIAQWQNGEPITVYPPASALKEPLWPKRTG
jgi:branched-chain amino acid transport system substrate-binding protein